MNSVENKEACSKENAFRVTELEEVLAILRREGAQEETVVESSLLNGKVELPYKFIGNLSNTFCLVICTFEEADAIVDILYDAEASSIPATGETTAVTSRLVDLVNRWSIYRETL